MPAAFKPSGYNSVSPYFIVNGAQKMIDLLKKIFNVQELRRYDLPDGTIMHVEVKLDDSVVMIADSNEQYPPIRYWFIFMFRMPKLLMKRRWQQVVKGSRVRHVTTEIRTCEVCSKTFRAICGPLEHRCHRHSTSKRLRLDCIGYFKILRELCAFASRR
jgi:uncharacterized glyoxalase superfamily protein PhnB